MRIEQLLRSNMLDGWLMKEHNKFRMPMPKDETSLFRAVSEQVYSCQNFYEKVQNHCILYLRNEKQELHGTVEESLLELQKEFQDFTEVEKLAIVSQTYRRNVVLYRKIDNPVEIIGQILTTKTAIYVRLTEDGFYESIRTLEYMKNAAFCQAILYEILYEKVFKFDRKTILEAVQNVRNKAYNTQIYHPQQRKSSYCSYNSSSGDEKSTSESPDKGEMLPYPPFPFRAAKALDPDFFRNAQYDLYLDSRRDSLHSVKPGDKVHVTFTPDDDRIFTGHVQEVSPNHGPVAVFVEELGKRTMVPYGSIIRLPQQQAKSSAGARQRMRRQFMGRTKAAFSDGSDEKVGSSPDSGCSQASHQAVYPPRFSQNRPAHSQASRTTFQHSSPPIGFQARPPTIITQPQSNINTDLGMFPSAISPHTSYYTQQRPDGIVYAQLPAVMSQLSPPLYMQPSYEDTEMSPPMTLSLPSTYAQQQAMGQYCQPMDCACYDGAYYFNENQIQYEVPVRQTYYQEVPMLSMPMLDNHLMGGMAEASSIALPVPHKDTIQVRSVNYQTQPSRDPTGSDMPLNDLDTLRYFYNLGCEYYRGVMSPGYPNYENTQTTGQPTIMTTPLPTTLAPVTQMQSVPPQC